MCYCFKNKKNIRKKAKLFNYIISNENAEHNVPPFAGYQLDHFYDIALFN